MDPLTTNSAIYCDSLTLILACTPSGLILSVKNTGFREGGRGYLTEDLLNGQNPLSVTKVVGRRSLILISFES